MSSELIFFQAYPLLLSIVKTGGHLGLEQCQKQFKNEIWNCTLDNKHVFKELPIFVKTTLPYGETVFYFIFHAKLDIINESFRKHVLIDF